LEEIGLGAGDQVVKIVERNVAGAHAQTRAWLALARALALLAILGVVYALVVVSELRDWTRRRRVALHCSHWLGCPSTWCVTWTGTETKPSTTSSALLNLIALHEPALSTGRRGGGWCGCWRSGRS
jgi:hypothetical protein